MLTDQALSLCVGQDKILSDCVVECGQDWEKVCDRIHTKVLTASYGVHLSCIPPSLPSVDDCRKRWKIMHPDTKTFPPWTAQEKAALAKMVDEAQCGDNEYFSRCITLGKSGERVRTISWVGIAQQLKRTAEDVSQMWSQIRSSRFKRGAYTEGKLANKIIFASKGAMICLPMSRGGPEDHSASSRVVCHTS